MASIAYLNNAVDLIILFSIVISILCILIIFYILYHLGIKEYIVSFDMN